MIPIRGSGCLIRGEISSKYELRLSFAPLPQHRCGKPLAYRHANTNHLMRYPEKAKSLSAMCGGAVADIALVSEPGAVATGLGPPSLA
jgi:hypothetical protein